MAGYSGTPLPKKLGIKEEHRVAVLGGPEGFEDLLEPLPGASHADGIWSDFATAAVAKSLQIRPGQEAVDAVRRSGAGRDPR